MRRRHILLAVDLSYQTYRACAAYPRLTSLENVFTGGLYGVLMMLGAMIRESRAERVIVCEDVKPYVRSLEYKDYKLLRRKEQDNELRELYLESLPLVKQALEEIGIPILAVPGFESDDCIGYLVRQHRHRFEHIYAASNDSDLWQLLGYSNFSCWRKTDKGEEMTLASLKKLGYPSPEAFALATAMSGTHNDIAGIPKVGEGRAKASVNDPAVMRKWLDGHEDLVKRNQRLIELPHRDFPHVNIPANTRQFDARAFTRWCAQYDIQVTASMANSFETVCP